MSEREPLLHDHSQQLVHGEGQKGVSHDGGRGLGPLDISRSTRYAILAGLWIATFLSVSYTVYYKLAMMSMTTLIGFEP